MADMKIHTVRVPDDLWARAKIKAKREGDQISTVIRRHLFAYVRDEKR
jgi:hypothetical protein